MVIDYEVIVSNPELMEILIDSLDYYEGDYNDEVNTHEIGLIFQGLIEDYYEGVFSNVEVKLSDSEVLDIIDAMGEL